jgi:hypothetical protein
VFSLFYYNSLTFDGEEAFDLALDDLVGLLAGDFCDFGLAKLNYGSFITSYWDRYL